MASKAPAPASFSVLISSSCLFSLLVGLRLEMFFVGSAGFWNWQVARRVGLVSPL